MSKTKAAPKAKKSKPVKPAAAPTLAAFISATLEGDKAKSLVAIDLRGKTSIADDMVIASGTSSRHVAAMATRLRDRLAAERKIKARLEGLDTGDWVIVDAGDAVVHLFREEVREFYNLEKLWGVDFATVAYTRYQSSAEA